MAKPIRTATSRIATTVNARFYPSSGASDTFYLDGRLTGRREHRAADITLDREDRGFFYSVFAHLGSQHADEVTTTRLRKSLDRILLDVKQHGRNIDAEINELAECAVDIAGRMTLQHEGVRQPYFAGVIVKDSEIAAITMGGGCAYLYRGDVLYPLTSDDFPLEAIDLNGKSVPGHDVYCAGVAGTVRYSNIAQLQEDDCLIVCNKELMEALGQREVLRLLYEAEDQADAAGLIITAAAAKLPGVPLQFMIGFVEAINAMEKQGGRMPFGRGLAGAGAAAAAKVPSSPRGGYSQSEDADSDSGSYDSESLYQPNDDLEATPADITADNYESDMPAYGNAAYPSPDDEYDMHDDDYYDDEQMQTSSKNKKIAFYLILAAICIACLFAIYNMIFGRGDDVDNTTTTPIVTTTTAPAETTDPSETTETTAETTQETTVETTTETTQETTAETTAETTQETTAETTSETTASAGDERVHTVADGDTLFKIASQYYSSNINEMVELIKEYNNLTSDSIQLGQEIKIPSVD